jgi:hypothetical protein
MLRSRSASPVRPLKWTWKLKVITQDGYELGEFSEECVNKTALEAEVLKKHTARRAAAQQSEKERERDNNPDNATALEIVRKYLPTCESVNWNIEGGLSDMDRPHRFHGPPENIETEFNTSVSLELSICLLYTNPLDLEDEADFSNTIYFDFDVGQIWVAESHKVTFELARERPYVHLDFGDWTSLFVTRQGFEHMMQELLGLMSPDDTTTELACQSLSEALTNCIEHGEIKFLG